MHYINVTIPAFNEEHILANSTARVAAFLAANCVHSSEILIANNASEDRTLEIAHQLKGQYSNVHVLHLGEKGRGRAIKRAWLESTADILCYMDVDLSTDLAFLPMLIEPLLSDRTDLAVGSRLLSPALTKRGFKREFISRSYNLLVKAFFRTRFSDAQCGFKAITREAASELLPLVEDQGWFFDTELLVLAEKLGYRIFDLPVRWTDDPDSRVKILRTALDDIRGMIRVRQNLANGKYASVPRSKRAVRLRA
jgi:glycosyltransferase involved in cell wall biosynthesis